MATAEVVPAAPAAVAAPVSAPAPASAPAPVSSPAAPASSGFGESSTPTTKVDAAKFPIREDYARELLKEKLGAIPQPDEAATAVEVEPEVTVEVPVEVAAPEIVAEPAAEPAKPEEPAEEEAFELEPEGAVTPESLTQMVAANPEFGKLLEADPKLKGQLYKTAREAAELKPYREIFPDVESAKTAQQSAATWFDVQNTFLGSTTREGAVATLAKIAELSYERGEDGQPVLENGNPVIGADFYGFVDNVVGLDLEHRDQEVTERLQARRYNTQEEADRDQQLKAALDIVRGAMQEGETTPELPEALRVRAQQIEQRERQLNDRQQTEKQQERQSFEKSLVDEGQKRILGSITQILGNVEKQGAVISPYLKGILPKAIAAKLVGKINENPMLQAQMRELQRLPIGDSARTRRLSAIDRVIQQYLPEIARGELREAGVQVKNSADAKRAKVDAQIDATKKTEPKGATAPSVGGPATTTATSAFDTAQGEWQKANPGKPFDKVAKEQILPRVLQLMTQR